MLALLQPTYGATLPRLPESDPMMKVLEKQVEARHAAIAPKGVAVGDVSLDSLVDSALSMNASYGVLTAMNVTEAATQYESTSKLLSLVYNGGFVPQHLDLDV